MIVAFDAIKGTAGTLFTDHVGDIGATWAYTSYSSTQQAVITNANRIRGNTAAAISLFYANGTPASADYSAEAGLYVASIVDSEMGVCVRMATNALTLIRFCYVEAEGAWRLDQFLAGDYLAIGSNFAQALTIGQTYVAKVVVVGSTVNAYVDGILRITGTTTVLSAGKAGVQIYNATANTNTTGIHLDYFLARDPVVAETFQLVCDGDSLTIGQDASTGVGTNPPTGTIYPAVTLGLLGVGWEAYQFGVGGQNMAQMAADAAKQIDRVYFPDFTKNVLIAWGSTNGLAEGQTAAQAYADYSAYCLARKAANSGLRIVAGTVTPRSNPGIAVGFEAERQAFNTLVRNGYRTFSNALADIGGDPTIGAPGAQLNPTYYYISETADTEVHFVDAGYAIVGQLFAAAVAQAIAPAEGGGGRRINLGISIGL